MNRAGILVTLLVAMIPGLPASAEPFALEVQQPEQRYRVTCTEPGPAARYNEVLLEEQFGLPNGASVELRDAEGATVVERYSPVVFSGRGFEPPRHRTAERAGPLTRWFELGMLFTGLETKRYPRLHAATTFRLTVAVSENVALKSDWLPMPDAVKARFQR